MSDFVVSARKYRPSSFGEVVGQEHISRTLKNALQSGKVAHAFLFCGPRGVGKTTNARILAKILNCENRTPDYEACNTCSSCKAFQENASFNISELDAASNNSVENIRALVEQVRFAPQQGRYRVFIIDEVHMLSQAAFNAFLKTLEEPPPYAIFILATTEKHKIIPTILSRCQIFDFRRITVPDTVKQLEMICANEGIKADADALHIIAQKADGAMRDALSIFDRIVSATNNNITYNDVIENLNVLDYDYFFKMTDALLVEDLPSVLLLFDEVMQKGFDADIFINGLATHLRNLLLCKDSQTLKLLEVSDGLRERYKIQAQLAPGSFILNALKQCNDCDINFKMARDKQLHTQMAIIQMTYINRMLDASYANTTEKKNSSGQLNAAIAAQSTPSNAVAEPSPSIQTSAPADVEDTPKINVPPPPPPKSAFTMPSVLSIKDLAKEVQREELEKSDKSAELTFEFLLTVWQDYLVGLESQVTRISLAQSSLSLDGSTVTINVPSTIAKSYLQQDIGMLRERIKEEVHIEDLVLDIQIDNSIAPANTAAPKKPMSLKEKYEKMKAQNPLIDELRLRFDLKIDGEG